MLGSLFLVAVLASAAGAESPDAGEPKVVVLKNVYVVTGADLDPKTPSMVMIRGGEIVEVGTDLKVPEGAQTIDGGGGKLTPGWIDSASRLWMTEASKFDTSSTSALRAVDGVDPFSTDFHHAVGSGVTSVVVTLSAGGRLGGDVALVAAAPTSNMFDSTVAEAEKAEAEKAEAEPKETDEKKSGVKKSGVKKKAEPAEGDKDEKKDGVEKEGAKEEEGKKKAADGDDEKKSDESKKSDEKKSDDKDKGDKDDKKEEDDEKIEVPYTPAKPELPFSSGKAGWVLSEDIGVAASLGVATADGKSRFDEFNALKKTLEEAEAYHKKWDEYRSWKAKQDLLPPDKRAKPTETKTSSVDPRRAEFMRRIAAMRAARSGTPAPKPEEKPKDDSDEKKSDGDKKEDSKDDKKKAADKVVAKPKFEAAKDRLRPVLRGETPLRIYVSDNASLRRALELAEVASIRLVLVGLTDVSASEIESLRWPIVLGPWVDQKQEVIDRWVDCLETYEGRFSIGGFGSRGADSGWLRMQAAAAVAAGVDPGRVLDAVTRSAADISGVGRWLGQIRSGQRADMTLFAGDPLDPATPVLNTWIAGESAFASDALGDKPDDSQSRVVALSKADRTELDRIKLPTHYALASNRILADDGTLRPGSITVHDGVIKSVTWTDGKDADGKDFDGKDSGAKAKPSEDDVASSGDTSGLPLLQLGDLIVMPGLVTARLAISETSARRGAQEPDAGYFRAADRFDPTDRRVREMVRSGVLWAALTPPSDNVAAGQIAGVRLGANDPIQDASMADLFVVARDARSNDRYPASLEGQFDFLRKRFAGNLQTNRTELPSFLASELQASTKTRYENLAAGKRRAYVQAESDAEIRGAVRLIRDLGLSAALLSPRQLSPMLDEILADGLDIVIDPVRAGDQPWYVDEIISAARGGSSIGIAASSASDLRVTAAMLIRHGLEPERVNQILTSEAAKCAGMPDGSATIRPGQPADLTVWTAPPGRLTGQCVSVIVDGQTLPTTDASRNSRSVR